MELRAIIEKLQNINIKDLQNIDVDQIKCLFLKRITLIINIIFVLITIIIISVCLTGAAKRERILKWENGKTRERIEAVEESEKIKKEYDAFLKKLPQPILADQLMSRLSQFAANRGVQVLSFVPQPGREDDHMDMAGVKLNLSSKDYRNLVLFAKDIENALYTMRIDKWSAMAKRNVAWQTAGVSKVDESVEVSAEISSVMLKYEQ
jgi:Tfp pilus assembly protein PilO